MKKEDWIVIGLIVGGLIVGYLLRKRMEAETQIEEPVESETVETVETVEYRPRLYQYYGGYIPGIEQAYGVERTSVTTEVVETAGFEGKTTEETAQVRTQVKPRIYYYYGGYVPGLEYAYL